MYVGSILVTPPFPTIVTPRRSALNRVTMGLDPEILETLHEKLVEAFQGAQSEPFSHKRRVKTLCKLHAQAITFVEEGKQLGQAKRVGEKKFNEALWKTIAHVLLVRKGVVEADRTVRLVGAFVEQLTTQFGMLLLQVLYKKLIVRQANMRMKMIPQWTD
jgi:hypothetical protein